MSRGFPANVATALAQQHVAIVTFAKLEFPSGTVYVHNSIGTYTWGSQDWLGVGDLGSISQVQEGLDVSPYSITLTLSGLDATISGAALTEDYYLHPVTVYLGVLDADDTLIADPTQIWAGAMDQKSLPSPPCQKTCCCRQGQNDPNCLDEKADSVNLVLCFKCSCDIGPPVLEDSWCPIRSASTF